AADGLQKRALVGQRPAHILLKQGRGIALDNRQGSPYFVAHRRQQGGLKLVHLMLTRDIAQEHASANGLTALIIHIEQTEMNSSMASIPLDFNSHLSQVSVSRLKLCQRPLTVGLIDRQRTERGIKR